MNALELSDQRHLEAAQGWLELGNSLEANEELENISAPLRAHPDVLLVRWDVYAKANKWELAAEVAGALTKIIPDDPISWIHLGDSLHKMNRTQEAWNLLLKMELKFPEHCMIPYKLACYACQLGELKNSLGWLERTFEICSDSAIKQMALDDPDFEPLRADIGKL